MKCPACKRRGSERHAHWRATNEVGEAFPPCPDPIHDLADEAPGLLEALERLVDACGKLRPTTPSISLIAYDLGKARAALSSARGSRPEPAPCEVCGVKLKDSESGRCYMHTHEREGKVVRDKHPGAPGPPYCCKVGCPEDAEFVLTMDAQGVPYDVAETHACVDHVGTLLGGPEDGPDVTQWLVTTLGSKPKQDQSARDVEGTREQAIRDAMAPDCTMGPDRFDALVKRVVDAVSNTSQESEPVVDPESERAGKIRVNLQRREAEPDITGDIDPDSGGVVFNAKPAQEEPN